MGEVVYFYRKYPNPKSKRLQAARGNYVGPGVVIGNQGKNLWIAFAGRCYLVAPEHVRGLAPDENASLRPLIREGLEQLKEASRSQEYIDISREEVPSEELTRALKAPADPLPDVDLPPVHVPLGGDGSAEDPPAAPIAELLPEEVETEIEEKKPEVKQPKPVEKQLEEMVDEHVDKKRPFEEVEPSADVDPPSQSSGGEQPPSTWKPIGNNDSLRWQATPKERDGPYLVIECELDDKLSYHQAQKIITDKIKKKRSG